MYIERIRHDWPEPAGFLISRPNGYPIYTFLHFQTNVKITLNGETVDAAPGACIFISPGIAQHFYAPTNLIHNWFHADESLGALLSEYGIEENRLLYPKDTTFISALFQRLEAECFSDSPFKQQLTECYMRSFLILLSRAISGDLSNMPIRENEKIKMRNVRKAILSQPEKPWTVQEMAALATMSRSRFHMAYKSYFGTSPGHDLIEARLRLARTLLLTRRELSVAQVAAAVGYRNEYHFIRLFKAAEGMPPGAFRKTGRPF